MYRSVNILTTIEKYIMNNALGPPQTEHVRHLISPPLSHGGSGVAYMQDKEVCVYDW